MLIAFQTLNIFTAHRLLGTHQGVTSDSFMHQTTCDFEKFLQQKNEKNNVIIVTLILQVIRINVGSRKHLEDNSSNAEYDSERRLYIKYTGLNRGDSAKLEKALALDNNNKDE